MKKNLKLLILIIFFGVIFLNCVDAKKLSRSRSSSSRGTGRRTSSSGSSKPAPSHSSNPQSSVSKPSLFGWQQKPQQTVPKSSSQSHSYPSSQTGLSGNGNQNNYKSNVNGQTQQSNSAVNQHKQQSHSYPASNTGLSGSSGTGSASYPHQQNGGLSGAAAPPPYPGKTAGVQSPNQYAQNHHQQGPPPPYSPPGYNSYQHGSYNNYGSYHHGNAPQVPGYFGNYGNYGHQSFGGMSRGGGALKGIGIAGAGVGTLLTGLALWNLARSTGNHHHTVVYDRGQPVAVVPANNATDETDILKDLVNCTLTVSNGENITEVLAIPCAIATSFRPTDDVANEGKVDQHGDKTTCTVTVVTKMGNEYMTTIPCSTLLSTAAANNVTEAPASMNDSEGSVGTSNENVPKSLLPETDLQPQAAKDQTTTAINCPALEDGVSRDPMDPCLSVTSKLTVIPIETTPTTSRAK